MSKKILAGGALAAVLALGTVGGGAAIASSPESEDEVTRGSITASETEYDNDAREDMQLKQRAELNVPDAAKAALDSQPGEITSVEVEDEEGYVVYEVEMVTEDLTEHEMKVDAGDGDILAAETEEEDDDEDEEDEEDGDDRDDPDDDDEGEEDDD